jgi:hypothetical protein
MKLKKIAEIFPKYMEKIALKLEAKFLTSRSRKKLPGSANKIIHKPLSIFK